MKPSPPWDLERIARFPRVMGIVNINDDSFCEDGTLENGEALEKARCLARSGADLIDAGAESARTNREAISEGEEIRRLLPFLEKIGEQLLEEEPAHSEQLWSPLISVNTWRPAVVQRVLETGVISLVNDMGGLPDPTNAELCAESGAALLIMHTVGLPKVSHTSQRYDDIWDAMLAFFEQKTVLARQAGLGGDSIVLDPGIDFAKQRDDNLRVLKQLERLVSLGYPVLLPASRKTVIGNVLGIEDPKNRDAGTISLAARGFRAGTIIFRVHDVGSVSGALRTLRAIGK